MSSRRRTGRIPWLALPALLTGACATVPAREPVDLSPARNAVAEAKKIESPPDSAKAFLVRAEEHLENAELSRTASKPEERARAEALATLALTEAEAATALSKLARDKAATVREPQAPSNDDERGRLKTRLGRAAEEKKKLEEKVILLQRDLDATETEVIRTKAKLKGLETKAEASSAIAEARILILRMADDKASSASLARCQEKLNRAERQLREENYGAALFFALQVQDLLVETRRGAPADPRNK